MTEFAGLVLDDPEMDEALPGNSYVYFQVADDPEFNAYSRELALRRQREEGVSIVCVQVQGLAPLQGSRLIDPRIVPAPAAPYPRRVCRRRSESHSDSAGARGGSQGSR